MKNYIQPGDVIPLIAASDVKSGDVVTVGGFTGIAATDAISGAEVEVALTGVFELPKAAAAIAQGALAYWSSGKVAASGTILLGAVVAAAGADSATCRVRLNGVVSAPAA
jgi:predicted RecA/RadA family phage recombinase